MRRHNKNITKLSKSYSLCINSPYNFYYLIFASVATYRCTSSELQLVRGETDVPIWWNYNISGGNVIPDGALETSLSYSSSFSPSSTSEPTMLYLTGNPYLNPDEGFSMSFTLSDLRLNVVSLPTEGEVRMVIPESEQPYQGDYDTTTGLDSYAIENAVTLPQGYKILLSPIQLSYLDSIYFIPSKDSPRGEYNFVFYLEELSILGDLSAVNIISAQLYPDNLQPVITTLPGQSIPAPEAKEFLSEILEGFYSNDLLIAEFNVSDSDGNLDDLTFDLFYKSANSMELLDTSDRFYTSYDSSNSSVQVLLRAQSELDYENNYTHLNIEETFHFFQLVLIASDPVSQEYIRSDNLLPIEESSKFDIRVNIIDKNEAPSLILPSIDLGSIFLESNLIAGTELLSRAFRDNDLNIENNQIDSIFFTEIPSNVLFLYMDDNSNNGVEIVLNERYLVSPDTYVKIFSKDVLGKFSARFSVADSGNPSLVPAESASLDFAIEPVSISNIYYSIDENNLQDTLVTTLTAESFNLADIAQYRKIENLMDDADLFDLNSQTGELYFKISADHETPQSQNNNNFYATKIEATDSNGNTSLFNIGLSINNLNDNSPVFLSPPTSLNFAEGHIGLIADINSYDPDSTRQFNDDATYHLSGSPSFTIDTFGNIISSSALDIKNLGETLILTITASDGVLSSEHVLTINIEDVNEAPIVATDTVALGVLRPASILYVNNISLISAFVDFDSSAPNNILTQVSFFNIPQGIVINADRTDNVPDIITEGTRYNLNELNGIEIALSDEMLDNGLYSIDFKAYDGGMPETEPAGNSELLFSVDTDGGNNLLLEINENNDRTSAIRTLSADDFGLSQISSYQILPKFDNQFFGINLNSSDLFFLLTADYEQPMDENSDNIYDLEIEASDIYGNTANLKLSLLIQNIDDNLPSFSYLYDSVSFNEGETGLLLDIDAYDPDVGVIDDVNYSLLNAPNYLRINSKGEIFVNSPIDREILPNGMVVFDVAITDNVGKRASQSINLTVIDVNEPPVVLNSRVSAGTLNRDITLQIDKDTLVSAFADNDAEDANSRIEKIFFDLTNLSSSFELTAHIAGSDQIIDHNFQIFELETLSHIRIEIRESAPLVPGLYSFDYGVIDSGAPNLQSMPSQIIFAVSSTQSNTMIITIPEENSNGLAIYEFQAADFILDSISEYRIYGDDIGFFDITPDNILFSLTTPDYENPLDSNMDNIYLFQIEAIDPQGSSSVIQMNLVIDNIDDNPFVFLNTVKNFHLIESYSGVIVDIDAYDLDDRDTLDNILYSIDLEEYFRINAEGIISTIQPLNINNFGSNMVVLTVTATKISGDSITTSITINIEDINESPHALINILDIGSFEIGGSLFTNIEIFKSAFADDDFEIQNQQLRGIVFFNVPDGVEMEAIYETSNAPLEIRENLIYEFNMNSAELKGIRITATSDSLFSVQNGVIFTIIDQGNSYSDETVRLSFALLSNDRDLYFNMDETTDLTSLLTTLTPQNFGLADGEVLNYYISGGADTNFFRIDGDLNNIVFFNSAIDYEEPLDDNQDNIYELEIEALTRELSTSKITLFLSINDINDQAPIFTSYPTSINILENSQGIVGRFTAYDPETGEDKPHNNLFYYTQGAWDSFSINEDGYIIVSEPLDYDVGSTTTIVKIYASDGDFISVTDAIVINIEDENEAPSAIRKGETLTFQNSQVPHNYGARINLLTFVTNNFNDPDINTPNSIIDKVVFSSLAGNNILRYINSFGDTSLINTGTEYEVNSNSFLYIEPDSSKGSFQYVLHVLDSGAEPLRSESVNLAFNVVGKPDFMNNNEPLHYRVRENTDIGITIATIYASDATSYTILGGDDQAHFNLLNQNIATNDVAALLSFSRSVDHENPLDNNQDNIYEIQIAASGFYEGTIIRALIEIIDEDEFEPYFLNSPSEIVFNEGIIGPIFNFDSLDDDHVDLVDYPEYSISGNIELFSIDNNTGVLSVNQEIDFDSNQTTRFIIEVNIESDGRSNSETVTIQVEGINDNNPQLVENGQELARVRHGTDQTIPITKFTELFNDLDYNVEHSTISSVIILSISDNLLLSDINNQKIAEGSKLSVIDFPELVVSSIYDTLAPYNTDNLGDFEIYFRVEDEGGLPSDEIAKAYVSVLSFEDTSNLAPFIDFQGNRTFHHNEGFIAERIFEFSFTDPESDEIIYSLYPESYTQGMANFELIENESGDGYYIYAEIEADYELKPRYNLTLTANDGRNIASTNFEIIIENINESPYLISEKLQYTTSSSNFRFSTSTLASNFEDPDTPHSAFGSLGDIEILDFSGGGTFNYYSQSIDTLQTLVAGVKYDAHDIYEISFASFDPNFEAALSYKLYDRGEDGGDVDLGTGVGLIEISSSSAFAPSRGSFDSIVEPFFDNFDAFEVTDSSSSESKDSEFMLDSTSGWFECC